MGDKPIISNNIVQPNKGTNLVLKNKPCHKIKAQTIDSHKKAEPRQRTAAMVQQSFLNQTYRLLACKWCSLCVGAGTKLFVEHIQAVAVVANHLQVVDDVLCGFFLFYLLIDKPLEHAACGIIVFLRCLLRELVSSVLSFGNIG